LWCFDFKCGKIFYYLVYSDGSHKQPSVSCRIFPLERTSFCLQHYGYNSYCCRHGVIKIKIINSVCGTSFLLRHMIIKTIKTKIFKPKDNLLLFIEKYLPIIKEGSVLAITSKIVALSENRIVEKGGKYNKKNLIKKESQFVLPTKNTPLMTINDGMVMANAGIDESNADGKIILLPKDSFKIAHTVRNYFKKKYDLDTFGVIITDSRSLPLRVGVTGVALGYAGFEGLKDYTNSLDIFGQPTLFSKVNIADSLATVAVLCMGEGNEQRPLAIINKVSIEYTNKINKDELKMDIKKDMYKQISDAIKRTQK